METLYSKEIAQSLPRRKSFQLRSYCFKKFYLQHLHDLGIGFSPSEEYLEVGVGYGDKMEKIHQMLPKKASIMGIDQSLNMLQQAKQDYPHLNLIQGDARNLEFLGTKKFNAVFFFQVLHHLTLQDIEKSLLEAKKHLKKNGKIVILDSLEPENIIQNWVFRFVARDYAGASIDNTAYKNPKRSDILDIAQNCGFSSFFETGNKGPYFVSEMIVFQLD